MLLVADRPSPAPPSVLDALLHPNETAAELASCVPQALLAEALYELAPAILTVDGRIDALVAVERHICMLQARSAELLASLDASDLTEDTFIRESVAAALRLAPAGMKQRMTFAGELVERLPATLELLRSGEVSQRHATDLADATYSLPADKVSVVEAAVLPRAPEQTGTQFRAAVHRAVLRVSDAATEEAAHVHAVTQRRVIFTPVGDGMTELWALLPADNAALLKATLDAMAHHPIHRSGGDPRTADQRRADALTDLARIKLTDPALAGSGSGGAGLAGAGLAGGGLAGGHGQRPAVQVTIAASTLMGLDDQPCELDGYGPITATMARRIAADPTATWRRLLTDDRGHVQHASTTSYRPTTAIIATVLARDQHCTFPGCRRAARFNDLDHITPWRNGDHTTVANLASLCRRHHRLKHNGTWAVHRNDTTGETTWTDRRTRTYQSRPPTLTTTSTTTTGPDTSAATTTPPHAERTTVSTRDTEPPPF